MRDIISNDTLARIAKTVDEIIDRMDSNTKRIEMPETIIDGDKVLFNYRQYDGVLYQVKVNDVNIIISDYTLDELLSDVHMRLKISKNKYVYVNIADKGFRMHGGSIEERTPTDYDVWIPDAYEFTNNGYAGRFTRDYYVPSEHTNIQYVQYLLVGLTVGEEYTFTFKSKIALHHSGTSVEWRDKPYGLLFDYDSTIDHEVVDVLPHDSGVWHSDVNFQSFYRDEQEHTYTCTITPEYSIIYITFIFDGVNSWNGYKSFTWSRFKSNKGINILDKEICFEGTWYSLGAGGGTSDLDAIELTYAEYQALTPAEKTDPDKIYFITDYPSGSGVVINPTGTATDTAETIEVDGTIYDFAGTDADAVHTADIGVAGGVAELDANGKVPSSQLPTYPTVGNGTITIQKNGTNVDTFTTNQSSNKTVNITMSKSDVGLDNVDNTSDANKPISIAAQAALDDKANASDVAGVQIVTGNPITITDGSETYAEELVVDLEPQQDLHGYDKPWVGGAGKNILNAKVKTQTSKSVKYTMSSNNSLTVRGASTGNSDFGLELDSPILVKAGDTLHFQLLNFSGTLGISVGMWINNYAQMIGYLTPNNGMHLFYTFESDTQIDYFIYRHNQSVAENNYNANVSCSIGEALATYEPYSNISPIQGYDIVSVDRCGKNLIPDGTDTSNGYVANSYLTVNGAIGSDNVSYVSEYFRIAPSTTYTWRNLTPSTYYSASICFYDINKNFIEGYTYNNRTSVVLTTPSNAAYARSTQADETHIESSFSFEEGSTATTYEPYTPNNHTLPLGQTVYGATVDVANGVMVVDKVTKTYDGSESWNHTANSGVNYLSPRPSNMKSPSTYAISNQYEKQSAFNPNANGFYIGTSFNVIDTVNGTTLDGWKTYLSNHNLQVCYELATPITIPLTPAQLKLLKGYNYISSNGTTIHLTYQPDNAVGDAVSKAEKYTDRLCKTGVVDTFNLYNGNTKVGSVSLLSNGFKLLYINSTDDGTSFSMYIPDKYVPKGPYQRAVVCLMDSYANPRIIEIYSNRIIVTEDKFEQGATYGTGLYY